MELHAHIERYQRDCDGGHSHDYVMTMTDEEKADNLGDVVFTDRVAVAVADFFASDGGRMTVQKGNGYRRLVWESPTDEGYVHNEATFCTDECDTGETGQTDEYAEMMGY